MTITKGSNNKRTGRKVFSDRRGCLEVTVWQNEHRSVVNGQMTTRDYYSVNLKRSFRQNDEWRDSQLMLPMSDLLTASRLLERADDAVHEDLRLQRQEVRQSRPKSRPEAEGGELMAEQDLDAMDKA
jgi:hypothetical protein